MPPYINPVNDFYMRSAATNMYQQPPYQQQFNFPPPQPRLPPIHSTWVTSKEEARASHTEDFLATNIFIDTSTGKIYMKRMDNDGKAQFLTYVIEEPEEDIDPLVSINTRLSKIESLIGGLNDKSIPGNAGTQQSKSIPHTATSEQTKHDDETESPSLPKMEGDDWWQDK